MHVESASPNHVQPRVRRFRFGLKTLFVVMTVLCFWLGGQVVRYRQSAAVVARYHAVSAALEQKMMTAPLNTRFIRVDVPLPSIERSSDKWRFRTTEIWTWWLDISKFPVTIDIGDAGTKIRTYYERGLDDLGLVRTATTGGANASAIWEMPQHGVYVIVDVHIDAALKQAHVRLVFLQNEKLSLW